MENASKRAEAAKIVNAKIGLYLHVVAYLLVNAGLISLNLLLSPNRLWFQWPLLGWGIGLLIHISLVFARFRGGRFREWMIQREMRKQ
jgi:hypothetical protein